MYKKADASLKEPGQKFAALPPDRHNEVNLYLEFVLNKLELL